MVGAAERNLKIIRESLGVNIAARDGQLRVSGDSQAVGKAAHVLEVLSDAARKRQPIERQELLQTIADLDLELAKPNAMDAQVRRTMHRAQPHEAPQGDAPAGGPTLDVYLRGRKIRGKTAGQQDYLQSILMHDLTFCIGPAGTGKTYLAVAVAAHMLKRGDVRKVILARPAVEAGEKLGFLPGDMQQKVNPYLRPLLDALNDMMEFDQIQRFMATDLIEVIPLAFMRGRTLNDAVVILDEAQNATRGQMMMFLTRMGHNSKMIVTGDTTQIDLDDPRDSGLVDAVRRLRRVPGIAFTTLAQADIVRHSLVQRIVEAYGDQDRKAPQTPTFDT
jgi:phosphate starvation-inducible PhoH-like protein